MEYLNRVEIKGTVTHDPKTFSVGDGSVTRFTVRTEEGYRTKSGELRCETTWHNVTAWSSPLNHTEGLRNGTPVHIVGRLRNTRYKAADGTERSFVEIVAQKLSVIPDDEEAKEAK